MIFVVSIFNIKITLGGNIPKDHPSQQNIMSFSGDKVDSASTFFPLLRDTAVSRIIFWILLFD